MFCHKCGKKLVEDAVFCSHCGEAVKAAEAPAGQDNNAHDDTAVKPARKVNKKALWIGISAAAVALIIAVAVQIITNLTSGFTFKNIPWGASKSEVMNTYEGGSEFYTGLDAAIDYPYPEMKFYGKKANARLIFDYKDDKLDAAYFTIYNSPDSSADFETLIKKVQRDYLKTADEKDDTYAIWDDDDYYICIKIGDREEIEVAIINNNY